MASSESLRVLLVDDDCEILDAISSLLRHRGFTISTASNGAAALDQLRRQVLDVVVLDYRMPGMCGLRLAERIAKAHADIPIIMLSGELLTRQVLARTTAPIFKVLLKPIAADLLELTIRKADRHGKGLVSRRSATQDDNDPSAPPKTK